VKPETATFLHVLATLLPARRAFEIGTGYGLSGLYIRSFWPEILRHRPHDTQHMDVRA
jgi:predicted O-methyltransferase YrrM